MTMLVDHGVLGGTAYVAMTIWILVTLRRLRRACRASDDFLAQILPAVAGSLLAITVGDLFVQYPKLEIRFWLITVLMAMSSMVYGRQIVRGEAGEAKESRPLHTLPSGRAA
jgi:hypothetical protein